MESIKTNSDFRFFAQWPFGVLMGAQTILSIVILVTFYFAPFQYEGTSFVIFVTTCLLGYSVVLNALHVFGIQRRVFNALGRAVYIPAALIVFLVSAVCGIGMAISTLIVFIGFIDSLRFKFTLVIAYAVLSVACGAVTAACAKIVVLMFRAAPNGQVMGLKDLVIEGDRTAKLAFAPTTQPTSQNV